MIQFRDVSVCYDSSARHPANALESVTLDVQAGEWVFFVGPSGAGKSTLLKLVYAGVLATHGRVFVDGQDVTAPLPGEIPLLRRKVGVVFQDFQLLSQKTVWENVAFALQVIGAPQKRLMRDVPRALETVGLESKGQARPHELSGGEQQRVAIARAIVNSPKVLIADEPTGNLDPRTADDIAEVLARVNARGTTILMATHDRPLVDRLKKRVVRIANHRVVSDDAIGYYHPEDDAAPVFAQHFSPQDETDALSLAATLQDEDDAQKAARVLAPPSSSPSAAPLSQNHAPHAAPPRAFADENHIAPRTVSAAPQNAALNRDAVFSPIAHAAPDNAAHVAAPTQTNAPQNALSQTSVAANATLPMQANAPQNVAPPPASTRDDADASAANATFTNATFETPPNGDAARSRNVVHAAPRVARDETAPLGSPENPIPQHDSGSAPPL